MVSVMAAVPVSGQWPESVDIRCNASDADDLSVSGPWMRGRNEILFTELIDQLHETLNERIQVLALVQSDTSPPYVFARAVWDRVDLLDGIILIGKVKYRKRLNIQYAQFSHFLSWKSPPIVVPNRKADHSRCSCDGASGHGNRHGSYIVVPAELERLCVEPSRL